MTSLLELEKSYGFNEESVKVIREQFKNIDEEMHSLETLIRDESCSQESWFYLDMLDKLRNTMGSIERRFQQMENKLKETRYKEQYGEE